MRRRIGTATASTAVLLLIGCGHRHKTARIPSTPTPTRTPQSNTAKTPAEKQHNNSNVYVGYSEEGTASWYGHPYHGRPAADGEIYNMEELVAAHRVIPFNTWLRVTNLSNLKTVDVRVIDRGPFVKGRIIDLSKAAARQIDLLGPGIGPVRLEVIEAPKDIRSNDYFAVQVGAFSILENAAHVRSDMAAKFGAAQIVVRQGKTPLYRVLVGKTSSAAEAQKLADQITPTGTSAMVVRLDATTPAGHDDPEPSSTLP